MDCLDPKGIGRKTVSDPENETATGVHLSQPLAMCEAQYSMIEQS